MHKHLAIPVGDLLFLTGSGRQIRIRDIIRAATLKVSGVGYTPGQVRIVMRNILDTELTRAREDSSHNNRVAATSFGHGEDTDAIWYRAHSEYEQGCHIWDRVVLRQQGVSAVDHDAITDIVREAFDVAENSKSGYHSDEEGML